MKSEMKIHVEHDHSLDVNPEEIFSLIKARIESEDDIIDDGDHSHKSEKPKFKFVSDFIRDVDSYIYTALHDCVELVAQKYLDAEKMYFTKSFDLPVDENGLVKAIDVAKFADKIRPYFKKAKGYFGKPAAAPVKIKKRVLYNPTTGKLLTNAEFEEMARAMTDFLGDRLKNKDEEFAVKAAFLGMMQRRFEEQGVPYEEVKDLSYEDFQKRFSVPSTTKELERAGVPKDSQLMRSVEYAKERAGEWLAIPRGRIRNNMVSAVRQQVVQALQENLTPQQLSQRLFYTDGSDDIPPNLRSANINAINRDWRRVAHTELSISMNNGYLLSVLDKAQPGQKKYVYYDGFFSESDKPGSKTDCNKWLGTICLLVSSPRRGGARLAGDPYAKYVVWPGKMNSDGGKTPSIPTHPSCKHWWTDIDPVKEGVEIRSAKTGKLLTKADLAKPRSIDTDGDVYVQKVQKKK